MNAYIVTSIFNEQYYFLIYSADYLIKLSAP